MRFAALVLGLLAAFSLGRLSSRPQDERKVLTFSAAEHAALHTLMVSNLEWLDRSLTAVSEDKPVLLDCPGGMPREVLERLPAEWKQIGGALHYECERARGLLKEGAAGTELLKPIARAVSNCVSCHRLFRAEISPTPMLNWNFRRDALVDR